jgi:hypothetical protein
MKIDKIKTIENYISKRVKFLLKEQKTKKELLTPEQKDELHNILLSYKDKEISDDIIHTFADKYKISTSKLESYIYGLAIKYLDNNLLEQREDIIPGGKGDKAKITDFDKKQILIGIAVEMEHTNDKKKSLEISLDHLSENPKYYSDLVESGIVDEKEALDLYDKFYGNKK